MSAANGEKLFKARCSQCHTVEQVCFENARLNLCPSFLNNLFNQ